MLQGSLISRMKVCLALVLALFVIPIGVPLPAAAGICAQTNGGTPTLPDLGNILDTVRGVVSQACQTADEVLAKIPPNEPELPGVPGLLVVSLPILSVPSLSRCTGLDGSCNPEDFWCNGCYVYNALAWHDHGFYEHVSVPESGNHAFESIEAQDHHAVLMNGQEGCHSGDAKWSDSRALYDASDSVVKTSGHGYSAWSDTWTLASGHYMTDDDQEWRVENGEIDICRSF